MANKMVKVNKLQTKHLLLYLKSYCYLIVFSLILKSIQLCKRK
jgi:hypothetical protein